MIYIYIMYIPPNRLFYVASFSQSLVQIVKFTIKTIPSPDISKLRWDKAFCDPRSTWRSLLPENRRRRSLGSPLSPDSWNFWWWYTWKIHRSNLELLELLWLWHRLIIAPLPHPKDINGSKISRNYWVYSVYSQQKGELSSGDFLEQLLAMLITMVGLEQVSGTEKQHTIRNLPTKD